VVRLAVNQLIDWRYRLKGIWHSRLCVLKASAVASRAATDEEILAAYHLVARSEGIFVEPASAASIAGLLKAVDDGWVARGSTVVCTVTGNGLKDPATAMDGVAQAVPVAAEVKAVAAAIGPV
jgi:threonine synthase